MSPPAWSQQKAFVTVQHTANIGGHDAGDVFVQCPEELVAWSGGADSAYVDLVDITASAPTFNGQQRTRLMNVLDGPRAFPTGWHVGARNADNLSHAVTATVLCGPVYSFMTAIVVSANVAAGTPDAPRIGNARPICPVETVAMGGGVATQFPSTMIVASHSPIVRGQSLSTWFEGTLDAPNGWIGIVRNEGSSGTIKVAAMCYGLAGVSTLNLLMPPAPPGATGGIRAACPAGKSILSGGFDAVDALRQGGTITTPVYRRNPELPVGRPDGTYPAPAGWAVDVRNLSTGPLGLHLGIVCVDNTALANSPLFTTVFEFHNVNLNHYFRTASTTEATAIDNGAAGPGWSRTGDDFVGYVAGAGSPGLDVCRFYTFGANSHFYTVEVPECIALQNPASGWVFEGFSFRTDKPALGLCAAGAVPVFRLYNNRFAFNDSNHRFTTSAANVSALQAQGWMPEGVAFCAVAD